MRKANILLMVPAAIGFMTSAALAQEASTGTITQINRLERTIAIDQPQSGTVGSAAGTAQQFKVQDAQILEPFHAGDRVKFTVTEGGGAKTITKIEKQ